MTESPVFHRSRGMWFACPHCSHRSYSCFVGANFSATPGSFNILYKCENCRGYARLRRPILTLASVLLSSVALFFATYALMLYFYGDWLMLPLVILAVMAVSFIGLRVISRLTNQYITVEKLDAL